MIDWECDSSVNIRKMVLIKIWLAKPEFTPMKIATSGLSGIYPYRQITIVESGSSDASAEEYLTRFTMKVMMKLTPHNWF